MTNENPEPSQGNNQQNKGNNGFLVGLLGGVLVIFAVIGIGLLIAQPWDSDEEAPTDVQVDITVDGGIVDDGDTTPDDGDGSDGGGDTPDESDGDSDETTPEGGDTDATQSP